VLTLRAHHRRLSDKHLTLFTELMTRVSRLFL